MGDKEASINKHIIEDEKKTKLITIFPTSILKKEI